MTKLIVGQNDLETWCKQHGHLDLLSEWDQQKNEDLRPVDILPFSNKKVWWKCRVCNYSWLAVCENRTLLNRGCPKCGVTEQHQSRINNQIKKGGSLMDKYPDIALEWHPTKNGDLKPQEVTAGSNRKVWWKCSQGHEWEAYINNRTGKGSKCPYCKGKKTIIGVNDLATTNPELIEEWDFDKNKPLNPHDFLPGSETKVWWKCPQGHEWETSIAKRTTGCGCPRCSIAKRVKSRKASELRKKSNFLNLYPQLVREWHPTKNGDLSPSEFTTASNKKIWWRCEKGHEWQTAIGNRTILGRNCPFCSGRRVIQGVNDLETLFPDLAKEWHPTKNGNTKPSDIKCYTNKKAWWKCSRGHEWQAVVNSRANGVGCPYCSSAGSSLPEQGVAFYLEQVCKIEQRTRIEGKEVDVYLPEYKIGVEYDGMYYHPESKLHKEADKNRKLTDYGIKLIRIKESNKNTIVNDLVTIIYFDFDDMGNNYAWAIRQLCQILSAITDNKLFNSVDIDIVRDKLKIRARYNLYIKDNSFAEMYPELAKEWNYEKNDNLLPEMFTSHTSIKVWWKCSNGHEWQTSIESRTRGNGCPFCSGQAVLEGVNDFQTWCLNNSHEYLLDEWDYEKNAIKPSQISPKTQKKAWWNCPNGHNYQTSIKNRANNHNCPICAHDIVLKNKTSITKHLKEIVLLDEWCMNNNPLLLKEWDYDKNKEFSPNNISYASAKKVWWKCSNGHEWQASIEHRSLLGQGCPICYRVKLSKPVRNLDTNEVFDSLESAAKSCGLKRGTKISYCCQGKRKTAGGYHWEYVD